MMSKISTNDLRKKEQQEQTLLNSSYVYFRGFDAIPIPDDRDEAYLSQSILSSVDTDWYEKLAQLESVHLLIKSYPGVSDLWALLVIGYRLLGHNCYKKLLLKGRIRFPRNTTLGLLSALEGFEPPLKTSSFVSKNLTDLLILWLVRILKCLSKRDISLAMDFFQMMKKNAKSFGEDHHWAIVEAALIIGISMEKVSMI